MNKEVVEEYKEIILNTIEQVKKLHDITDERWKSVIVNLAEDYNKFVEELRFSNTKIVIHVDDIIKDLFSEKYEL